MDLATPCHQSDLEAPLHVTTRGRLLHYARICKRPKMKAVPTRKSSPYLENRSRCSKRKEKLCKEIENDIQHKFYTHFLLLGRSDLQNSDLSDGHLLEILRTKDAQLVEFESETTEKQKKLDHLDQQLAKHKDELETYQHLLEVSVSSVREVSSNDEYKSLFQTKDESIVRLTNQLHEMELNNVKILSSDSPKPCKTPKGTSNGLSFDSDKFEFREFVDVACQTVVVGDKEKEDLQDTVMAYEMQNRQAQ